MTLNSQSSGLNLVSQTAFPTRGNAQSDREHVVVIFVRLKWKDLPIGLSVKRIGHGGCGGTKPAVGCKGSFQSWQYRRKENKWAVTEI